MGSWNATCGITQLAIEDGERTVLFVLRSIPKEYLRLTGPGILPTYDPVGAPMYGTYNTYGTIDPDTDREKYHLSIMKVIGAKETDVSDFLAKLERGKLSIDDSHESSYGFGYSQMMVKESALTAVLKHMGQRERGYQTGVTYQDAYTTALTTARDRYAALEGDIFDNPREAFNIQMDLERALTMSSATAYQNYLNPQHTHTDMVAGLVDVLILDKALNALRKPWSSQSGAGSQDTELDLTKVVAEYSLTEIERVKASYEEDWYDEDEEDEEQVTETVSRIDSFTTCTVDHSDGHTRPCDGPGCAPSSR